ncbi:MAG: M48 family metalloprotease [Bdellovibrionia bacterium]
MATNLTKVWTFIIVTSFLILALGYHLGDRVGLLAAFAIAIAINTLVFFFGDDRLLLQLRAQEIKGQDAYGALKVANELCRKLQLEAPRVFVFESHSPTSFCVGHSWQQGSLVLSSSLFKKLSEPEIRAVLAYQLCRFNHLDTFRYSVSSTFANTLVGLGEFLDRVLPVSIFTHLFSPFGWLIVKSITSEKSYFVNDEKAAKLIEDRYLMAKTLWKLNAYAHSLPLAIPACSNHLFIVDPNNLHQNNIFLKSHPSIKRRITKLMGYYPL